MTSVKAMKPTRSIKSIFFEKFEKFHLETKENDFGRVFFYFRKGKSTEEFTFVCIVLSLRNHKSTPV